MQIVLGLAYEQGGSLFNDEENRLWDILICGNHVDFLYHYTALKGTQGERRDCGITTGNYGKSRENYRKLREITGSYGTLQGATWGGGDLINYPHTCLTFLKTHHAIDHFTQNFMLIS